MKLSKKFALVPIAAALLGIGSAAHAQTTTYSFGTQLTGSPQPASSFATMSVNRSNGGGNYTFDLQLTSDFGSLFNNSNAYVSQVLFNTNGTDPIGSSVVLAPGTWGVSSIKYHSNSVQPGSISFDFSETVGGGGWSNRLTSGERVNWYTNFANPTNFVAPEFALNVQHFGRNGAGSSGWYIPYVPTVTPIPEPETYAMLLAGLGLMGFVARRRRQTKI